MGAGHDNKTRRLSGLGFSRGIGDLLAPAHREQHSWSGQADKLKEDYEMLVTRMQGLFGIQVDNNLSSVDTALDRLGNGLLELSTASGNHLQEVRNDIEQQVSTIESIFEKISQQIDGNLNSLDKGKNMLARSYKEYFTGNLRNLRAETNKLMKRSSNHKMS